MHVVIIISENVPEVGAIVLYISSGRLITLLIYVLWKMHEGGEIVWRNASFKQFMYIVFTF